MAADLTGTYGEGMDDIGVLLGRALRSIRKRVAGTQERWEERTGMSQTYLSDLENGKAWGALRNVASALERAGVDPIDLLREAIPAEDPEMAEVLDLWRSVGPDEREAMLTLMRTVAARRVPPTR